jgi:hypothetical protein
MKRSGPNVLLFKNLLLTYKLVDMSLVLGRKHQIAFIAYMIVP